MNGLLSVPLPSVGSLIGRHFQRTTEVISIPFFNRSVCVESCLDWDKSASSFYCSTDALVPVPDRTNVLPELRNAFRAILGMPGSGKTLFLWTWCLRQCIKYSRVVVFFLRVDGVLVISPCKDKDSVLIRAYSDVLVDENWKDILLVLQSFISPFQHPILVFDGLKAADMDPWFLATSTALEALLRKSPASCPLVLYGSSVGALPSRSFRQKLGDVELLTTWWPSWLTEEYRCALQHLTLRDQFMCRIVSDPAFASSGIEEINDTSPDLEETGAAGVGTGGASAPTAAAAVDLPAVTGAQITATPTVTDETLEEVIAWKYGYAGGSARHFFAATVAQIRSELIDALQSQDASGLAKTIDSAKHVLFK
eukprot:m.30252 g.30252  ORF g.30252 m.30252 type:complete len:367 (-) comp4761_c0_seq1:1101-2201(-)